MSSCTAETTIAVTERNLGSINSASTNIVRIDVKPVVCGIAENSKQGAIVCQNVKNFTVSHGHILRLAEGIPGKFISIVCISVRRIGTAISAICILVCGALPRIGFRYVRPVDRRTPGHCGTASNGNITVSINDKITIAHV